MPPLWRRGDANLGLSARRSADEMNTGTHLHVSVGSTAEVAFEEVFLAAKATQPGTADVLLTCPTYVLLRRVPNLAHGEETHNSRCSALALAHLAAGCSGRVVGKS